MPGVTLTVVGTTPLIIHCAGKVTINGTLNASGSNGTDGVTYTSAGLGGAGTAGGANGGDGTFAPSNGPIAAFSGSGTGAGGFGSGWPGGGGEGYSAVGGTAGPGVGVGGPIYGTPDIVTLNAGSGGGGGSGGSNCGAGGGGGGGGLIQIASCDTITITEPPVLTVAMSHTDKTTAANNGTATAMPSGGTPGYTYLWSPGGGTTSTITGLGAGTYTVVVTDTNGCSKTDTVTVLNTFLSVGTQKGFSGISVFPNPANDILNIQMDIPQATDISIILMDYTGRVLETNSYKTNHSHESYRLKMNDYANGNYFLKIKAGDQAQNIPVSILR